MSADLIDLSRCNFDATLRNQISSFYSRNASLFVFHEPWTLGRALRLGRTPLPVNEAGWGQHSVGPLRIVMHPITGLGVFATRFIPPGAYIIAVRGSLVRLGDPQTDEERAFTWTPAIHRPEYGILQIDPAKSNITRFLRASAGTGNVEIEWHCNYKIAVVRASQLIPAGFELLCPY